METREESVFSFMSGSGNFKEFNFKTDIERVKYLYKTKGHLQVNIGTPQVTISEDKRWLFITFKVNEGPAFYVNNINFEGDLLFTQSELFEGMKLKKDELYSEELLRFDIQRLTEMYQDKGYAFANVYRTLKVVPGEDRADVFFGFEKGSLAKIGKIIVKGNSKTRDKVIRRELTIKEGMLFSGSAMRVSKENVNRLGFFEPTSIIFNTVARENEPDVLDVEISIKEKETGQFVFGAGYSTASKAFIQASISKTNFLGLGQELNFTFNYASKSQEYSFGYFEPYLFDSKWSTGSRVYYITDESSDSFSDRRKGVEFRFGHPIFDYTRFYTIYRLDETKIFRALDPTVDVNLENGIASTVESYVELDIRDNRYDPLNGTYARLSGEYTGLGGDKKWSKAYMDARFYKNFYGDFVFRTRLYMAQLFINENRDIPRSNKFYLGGSRDLRGYGVEDIGPKRDVTIPRTVNGVTENVIIPFNMRGMGKVFANIELEHPLIKEGGLKWVLFYDVGNIYRRRIGERHPDDSTVRMDWGFGFRWLSPIGQLRFEFGYPINKRPGDDGRQFHFDIGQLF